MEKTENTINAENTIKAVKAKDLVSGKWYTVKKSGFKKATGKSGDFMSAWFLIENENGEVAFVNAPNERDTQRYIGIVTACKLAESGKSGLNVKKIRFVQNGDFTNMNFIVEPWEVEDTPF